MITLKKQTAERLAALMREAYPTAEISVDEIIPMLEIPPDPAMGDLALPCFKLSKLLRTSPIMIAEMKTNGSETVEGSVMMTINPSIRFSAWDFSSMRNRASGIASSTTDMVSVRGP